MMTISLRPFLLPHWSFRVRHKIHPFDNTSQIMLLLFSKSISVTVCRNELQPQGGNYRANTSKTKVELISLLVKLSKCKCYGDGRWNANSHSFRAIKECHQKVFVFLCWHWQNMDWKEYWIKTMWKSQSIMISTVFSCHLSPTHTATAVNTECHGTGHCITPRRSHSLYLKIVSFFLKLFNTIQYNKSLLSLSRNLFTVG